MCILPEGTVRESYKERVIEKVIETMCDEPYDPNDPEKIVVYTAKPRELLIAHEPFRMMFSDEINDIAEDILGDDRLRVHREQFDVWDIAEKEYGQKEK